MDYSHSSIGTFEKCPRHYYYRYVLKLNDKEEFPSTIEKHMGTVVHETMEHLYRIVLECHIPDLEDLLSYYDIRWDELYRENITIADKEHQGDPDYYRETGRGFVRKYYDHHYPFDDMTVLSIEDSYKLDLPDGNRYYVKMDKLARIGNDYFVCDYKTDGRMKTQEEADNDRQLAMYSVWVKEQFPQAERVHLLWHMLRFDTDVISERTDEQLESLKNDVVGKISQIESLDKDDITVWNTDTVHGFCGWCEYRKVCPEHAHEESLKGKDTKQFSDDDGVRIVDELSSLKERRAELKKQQDAIDERKAELESDLAEFCSQKGYAAVIGTDMKASVSRTENHTLREDRKADAKRYIIDNGLEDLLQINSSGLRSAANKGDVPGELMNMMDSSESVSISLKKRTKKDAE